MVICGKSKRKLHIHAYLRTLFKVFPFEPSYFLNKMFENGAYAGSQSYALLQLSQLKIL